MTKETGVIELGIKGKDIVMATLNKANAIKDKFSKPVNAKINVAANITAKGPQTGQGDSAKEESKVANAAKSAGNELSGLAKSAASLDPGTFLQGITGALGRAAAAIPIPIVSGFAAAAAEVAGAGISAAQGALASVKAALPVAIDTMEKESRNKYLGGGQVFGKNTNYSIGEQSALIENLSTKYGRINDRFGASVKRFVDANKDVHQVQQLAGGNFKALGTDEGFFLDKIASQFQGLPPTMAQELQGQLMDSLDLSKVNDDAAKEVRRSAKGFDDVERGRAKQLSSLAGAVAPLNVAFTELSVRLTKAGASLSGMVSTFANAVGSAIEGLPEAYKTAGEVGSGVSDYLSGMGGAAAYKRKLEAQKGRKGKQGQ